MAKDIYFFSLKKKNKRYELGLKVDNDTVFIEISEDLLVEFRLLSYRKLNEEEYQRLLNKIPLDSLIFEGEKYLNRKQRTIKETKNHLLSIASSNKLVDEAIDALSNKSLLDDDSYLSNYLIYAIEVKKEGRKRIDQSLEELGLKGKKYDYPKEYLIENINFWSKKYSFSHEDLTKKLKIDKIKLFLLQKGYTESEIENYLDYSLISSSNEKELIKKDYQKLYKKYEGDTKKIYIALKKKGYSDSLITNVGGK